MQPHQCMVSDVPGLHLAKQILGPLQALFPRADPDHVLFHHVRTHTRDLRQLGHNPAGSLAARRHHFMESCCEAIWIAAEPAVVAGELNRLAAQPPG
jgi:hypothetical protein